ncbi:DUF3466 family protein [Enterovibrio sp. ZSDZ35]|uniref:DUF3466 family protein n=1 Tax=Enterovibrio qingdaonensis TaxID=2899818 RepID=A0ABT5QI56_9GAMM|nr:DUF3466 family protein [Enterovibrio sp. ZSDZ35]MDD1780666.1 DUF3466 family protein [Enterovibrio sp. ZSDZ35]
MQFNTFKLSAIALAIASLPTVANAAVYTVDRVDNASASESAKATAISPNSSSVGYEVLAGPEGIDYTQEVPFYVDQEHFINSVEDLTNYCENRLGYATCGSWADEQWYGIQTSGEICNSEDHDANVCVGGIKDEIDAWTEGYTSNSKAFTSAQVNPFGDNGVANPPSGSKNAGSTNVVINQVDDSGTAVGSSSSPYYQSSNYARAFQLRGFTGSTELLPPTGSSQVISTIGQTNANGSIDLGAGRVITFGSASQFNMADPGNENKSPEGSGANLSTCSTTADYTNRACQYFEFANQASVWVSDYSNPAYAHVMADFPNGQQHNEETAQASVKGAAFVSAATSPTMVGYSTYNNDGFFTRAVKFTPIADADFSTCIDDLETNTSKRCWTMATIPNIDVRNGNNDIIYSYTVATDINTDGVVVGVVKNQNPQNGSYAENIFVNKGNSTTVLQSGQSNLFFYGYNATAASINNNNELVGKVDVENVQDRIRKQRGYIYLNDGATYLASTFNNTRGWLLDDLTNDGNASGEANKYRIAEAFDINDKGDISASAFYCAPGYSSTAQNAQCIENEQLVAVKLTRNNSGTITPRTEINEPVKRSGASFGLLGLGLLVVGGFWRRKK